MPQSTARPLPSKRDAFILGRPEDRILRAVNRYPYLTAVQLVRLCGYSNRSLTHVQTKLKALATHDYLLARRAGNERVAGSAPLLYAVHRKGRAYLAGLGIEVAARFRPSDVATLKTMHLQHTKELNDVLIAAELLTQQFPHITVAQLIHERALKRTPFTVALSDGTTQRVIPDAWLDLHITERQRRRFPVVIELDRGTMEQGKWRKKIAAFLSWSNGAYQKSFNAESLTVAVVATVGEKRRNQLKQWTEHELSVQQREREADLFRFTAYNVNSTTPTDLFLAARWAIPFSERLGPLLSFQEGESARV